MSLCKQAAAVSGTLRIYTAIIVKDLKPVRISFILRISLWRQIWVTTILLLILYHGVRQSINKPLYAYFIRCRRRIDERYGYDELNGNDSLNLEEISYGISAAGVNFDMLSFDSSLMEVLKLRRRCLCADYMTAPQDVIGNDEWNYEYVLQYLSDNPSTDSQGIGEAVCDGYYAKCEEKGTDKDAAMSCVALDNMSTLNQAFDGMAGDMLTATDSLLNYVNLSKAISGVQLYGGATVDEGFSNSVDLGDMAVKTSEFVGNTSDVLINTLNETVLYRVCGEKANSTGLALYYPLWENNDELQEYMEISNSVKYKEFLRKICTRCNVEDTSNTEDFNSSWAWNTYNQDMQTMEYKTILDGNSYELNILGNMDMFKSVDINVYKADKRAETIHI